MTSTESEPARFIETCPDCAQTMDVSALRPYSNVVCPGCGQSTRVMCKMGGYLITGKIGIGGMSVVYKAVDTILGREVALKVLNETYGAQPERIAKFEEEARVMAKVQHDHMVKIYAVGREWDCFYIAMELVNGGDLETRVRDQGPIPEPRALEIAIQIVDGLDTAWEAGMLHRDIKPANILLDHTGTAKIVDFGLALLNTQDNTDKEIWATPYYASPETLMRHSEDLRSDMYALGCTLFQILVGKPPFEKIPDSIKGLLEIKKKLPPLQKVAPDISPATSAIINRLTAYEPQKRYASYPELKRHLQAALDELNGHDDGLDWAARRRTLIRRSRRAKIRNISLIGLTSVALAGLGSYLIMRDSDPAADTDETDPVPPPSVADAGAANTREQNLANIGRLYQQAETALQNDDLPDARRYFRQIMTDRDSPLSTYAWSAFQYGLCSWALGSRYEGDSALRQLLRRLRAVDQTQLSPGVFELFQLVRYLTAGESEPEQPEIAEDSVTLPCYLAADALKQWDKADYLPALKQLEQLETLAGREGEDQQTAIAKTWARIMKPYLDDSITLRNLSAMPSSTREEITAKQHALSAAADKQTTPGIAFRQALKLMETSIAVSLQEISDRDSGATGVEIVDIPPYTENAENNGAGNTGAEIIVIGYDQLLQTGLDHIKNRWAFGSAAEHFRQGVAQVQDPEEKVMLETLGEMAGDVDLLISGISKDIGKLPPASRIVTLTDGVRVSIKSLDNQAIQIESHPQDKQTVPLPMIGATNLVNLHRECVNEITHPVEIISKRHAAAVIFLYLIGQTDQATQAATILSSSDPEFQRDWKRWMIILNK